MADIRYLAGMLLAVPLAACGGGDPAQTLAECQARLADIQAEREAFVNEAMGGAGEMRALLDGGEVPIEELDRFAGMSARIDEFENRLAVQQQRCDELAAGQE